MFKNNNNNINNKFNIYFTPELEKKSITMSKVETKMTGVWLPEIM